MRAFVTIPVVIATLMLGAASVADAQTPDGESSAATPAEGATGEAAAGAPAEATEAAAEAPAAAQPAPEDIDPVPSRSHDPDSPALQEGEFDEPRLYVLVGGLTGFDVELGDSINDLVFAGQPVVDVKPGVGFSLRFGGRSKHVGAEAVVDAIPSFRAKVLGTDAFRYSQVILGANLRFYLPIDRVHPNLIVGGGYGFAVIDPQVSGFGGKESFSGGALRGGGGVDVYLTDHVALSLDATYVFTTGDIEDSDYVTFGWGLLYRF